LISKAIVLINTDLGAERDVANKLRSSPYVTEAHLVYGTYDIIAIVEADTPSKLKDIITYNIRGLDKIRTTISMIVVEMLET
jgi:DNA-binding Lrp family transcriptional regulator